MEPVILKSCPFCGSANIIGAIDLSGPSECGGWHKSIMAQVTELAIAGNDKHPDNCGRYALVCNDCEVFGPWTGEKGTMRDAVELWNKRG